MAQVHNVVGRRTVLQLAVATVAMVSFPLNEKAAAAAGARTAITLSPTSAGRTPVLVPGSRQMVEAPTELGVVISGGSEGLSSGSVVTFEFDHRLYDADARVTATAHGRTLPVHRQSLKVDNRAGTSTLKVVVNEAIAPGSSATMIVGRLRPRRYPLDVLRDYEEPQAEVRGRRSDLSALKDPSQTHMAASIGQPWACEVGVLWLPLPWDNEYRSYCARMASVLSIGPGAIPAGYRVRILADPAVVSAIRVVKTQTLEGKAVKGSVNDVSAAGVRGIEWIAKLPLATGQQLQIELSVISGSPSGTLPSIKHPTVEVIAPTIHRGSQRTSYLESVVRQDSIYDAESMAMFS